MMHLLQGMIILPDVVSGFLLLTDKYSDALYFSDFKTALLGLDDILTDGQVEDLEEARALRGGGAGYADFRGRDGDLGAANGCAGGIEHRAVDGAEGLLRMDERRTKEDG